MRKLLVVSCAALGVREARRAGLERFGPVLDVEPVFPAVTVPAQAALLTGQPPAATGAVANGFYCRTLRRAMFWEQAADLVEGRRFWERVEEEQALALQAGLLFMQNSVGTNADVMVTPAPVHGPDGRIVPALATRPLRLAAELEAALGPFPLHTYWGPMAGLASSRWISAAVQLVMKRGAAQALFAYIPHLDYDLQRFGPGSEQAGRATSELDGLLEELVDAARNCGYLPIIVGDYIMEDVSGIVRPNLGLRQARLFAVREAGGREIPDFGSSLALAVVDHQVAHVYCQNGLGAEELGRLFVGAPGIGRVLDRDAQREAGIDHSRGGDLVLEAAPGHWFAYDWWTDEDRAPPWAATVDIHSKPGYDPLELFPGPTPGSTARDAALVKGTHGRSGVGAAALVLPEEAAGISGNVGDKLAAVAVNGLLASLVAG